jgi:hypothetical protein
MLRSAEHGRSHRLGVTGSGSSAALDVAPARVGPAGAIARLAVGLACLGLALFWDEVGWQQLLLGLFVIPATVGAALLFYGASMIVAALRRAGGCEVTALSNALLHRDDQVGCVLFAPIDLAEQRARRASRSAAADHWT